MSTNPSPELVAGNGRPSPMQTSEMAMTDRVAAQDWSATPLGPPDLWPEALKVAFQVMITSRFPMFIWWGPELINLYNDAYVPMLGKKHPAGFGRPAAEVWYEIWDVVGAQADLVIKHRQSTWNEEMLLVMERYGYSEETYFTWSYSPIGDGAGNAAGLFCAVTEDTSKVIGRRRLKTLRELAAETADLRTAPEAFSTAADVIGRNPYDLPFALLYEITADANTGRLACAAGLNAAGSGAPVELGLHPGANPWGFDLRSGEIRVIRNLDVLFSELPRGPWPEGPVEALLVPFAKRTQEQPAGFMIAGVNRYTVLDDEYRGFLGLVAAHIATAVANSRAYEAERKRAEALAEIDRAKTTFFSNVSHEFRTPLTLMLGPLEDALANAHGVLPPGAARDLSIAHRNALRLLKLVNTLLDFARIEAGRIQAVYEPLDLAAATKDVASVFQSAMERAGIKFIIVTPPLDQPVFVDREMWEKIVLNLLSNALKFTFEGEIRVSLNAVDGMVHLLVSDTGTGIPASELPRVFERFHRVTGVRGRSFEGSGIGLALIQELVKLHGGSVAVESREHHGTRFTVSIPQGKAHLPAERIGAPQRPRSTAAGAEAFVQEALRMLPDLEALPQDRSTVRTAQEDRLPLPTSAAGRPRILVADDNADMRHYARRLLSRDYEVAVVSDGADALTAIRAKAPDLVLSDVMMPGLDGFGLVRALRADPATRDIPVILLTARAGEEERIEGLETGADEYITKPFSARELLARVEAALKLQRVRGESNRALRESERRLSRLVEGLTRLHHLGRELTNTASEAGGTRLVLGGMVELYGGAAGLVSLPDPVTGELHESSSLGFENVPADSFKTALRVSAATSLQLKQPVIIADIGADPSFERLSHATPAERSGALCSFPLQNPSGDCLAIVSIFIAAPHRPDELELQLSEMHARQAADFIARVRVGEALRESEHQYRTLFNSMDEGFCTIEVLFDAGQRPVDYCFLEVNAAFEKQTGLRNAKGKRMREIAPFHEEHWFDTFGRIVLSGEPARFESEARQLGRWFDVYAFPIDRPELHRVAIVFNDVTERRRREELLRHANRDLEQFAYSASHDLQEPIRTVAIYSELLALRHKHNLDGEALQYLEYIQRGADRMGVLVRDLLTYTRVTKLEPGAETADSNQALEASLLNLDGAIRSSGAQIIAGRLPTIAAHQFHLQQLLQNLIGNAIKYRSAERAPVVQVSAEQLDGFWVFAVSDNGIGIEPEYKENVFGLFKRLHTSAEYSGSGIGLAICKRIVERYGGRIWVDSEPGRGSTFRFTLPVSGH